jgi:hypothetical protein
MSAEADVPGSRSTRADLFKRGALLGGTALATGGVVTALAEGGSGHASARRDVALLNYVLRLERLKAAFYREAAAGGALRGELQQLAEILARHERAHVLFLERRLGHEAASGRNYDFENATGDRERFASTARKLEETAVAAYIGQGPNLTRSLMVPFAQMCSVEARHAAWINDVLDRDPAPRAADEAKSPRDVLAVVAATGFEVNT